MRRKGQGLSMTVIIVAAIALLVLVVLSIIFLGKMGDITRDISACEQKGGQCVASADDCSDEFSRITSDKCEGDEVCCLTIAESDESQ